MAIKENKDTYRIYIRSLRKWVDVSEDEYQEHVKFYGNYRHRMQTRGFCRCPRNRWWTCDGDCLSCEYHRTGNALSLDAPLTNTTDNELTLCDTLKDTSIDFEELVTDQIVLQQLFKRLDDVMPEARNIGKLRQDGLKDAAIAEELKIPRTTLLYRINKAAEILATEYPDFFK